MKDCNLIQKPNHLMFTMLYFLACVVLILILLSPAAYCQTINGTATGNIMNGGYAAATDAYSVYADTDNGYALMLEKDGQTVTADSQNAGSINACGDTVYYVSVNGVDRVTELCSYDVNTNTKAVLLSVPLIEGMKNLYVNDGIAYFQSNNRVKTYDLSSGNTAQLFDAAVQSFAPADGGIVYTVFAGNTTVLKTYAYDTKTVTTLGEKILSFDVEGDLVCYSDGESGLYVASLDGSGVERLADGATNIVCREGQVYWQNGEEVLSSNLNGKNTSVEVKDAETVSSFSVLDNGVEAVSEEIGEPGSSDEQAALSSVSLSALPNGSYKDWKQSDTRWGGNALGSSTISKIGCLATAVSILLVGSGAEKDRYLAGTFDPGVFVKEMTNNGGFTSGGGMIWGGISKVEPSFSVYKDTRNGGGFGSLSDSSKASAIGGHLAQGRYITICVDNPTTGNTHWVAADYVDGTNVYECDPGYRSKTGNLFNDYASVTRLVIFSYSGAAWAGEDSITSVAKPNISVSNIAGGAKITLTSTTSGATIYYTTDGSEPTTSSNRYDGAFEIYSSATIKAIAVVSGSPASAVTSYFFTNWENPFSDVKSGKWYYSAIAQACEYGLFKGTTKTTFSPDVNTTRGQFVTIISAMVDVDASNFEYDFDDVDDNRYYASDVYWAANKEIVAGTTQTTFSPDNPITREQICVILTRLADKLGVSLSETESSVTFKDNAKISNYAKEAVGRAQRAGLVYGLDTGNFDPKGYASRAQVAAIVMRFMLKM